MSHRKLKANAKLEATLKKKKTLDLAQILEADQATHNVVAPENMKELVNSLVDKRIDDKGKQKQKELLKTALKAARKKSLGGANNAKASPNNKRHGDKPKGILKQATFGATTPLSKRAKKQSTQTPEKDYKALER
jgi:hypothetical protein